MKQWSWMWLKQGQIEVECGDENGYEDITKGYNAGTRDYDSIREVIGEKEKELEQQVQIDYQECY